MTAGRVRGIGRVAALAVVLAGIVGHTAGCGRGEGRRPVDEVYAEITVELDAAYRELGRPRISFARMSEVQRLAMDRLSKRRGEWPPRTSYSLSAMPDHVVVLVASGGVQRRGEWRP